LRGSSHSAARGLPNRREICRACRDLSKSGSLGRGWLLAYKQGRGIRETLRACMTLNENSADELAAQLRISPQAVSEAVRRGLVSFKKHRHCCLLAVWRHAQRLFTAARRPVGSTQGG